VGAVRFRLRAELRTKWKSVVALALLVGVAGAVVLAAIAGARRTDDAFARMLRETRAADVLVNPDFGNDSGLDPRAVAALPMVSESGVEHGVSVLPLPVQVGDLDRGIGLAATGALGDDFARPKVLHGRLPRPDSPDEVLVNPRFARHHRVSVGDTIDASIVTQDELLRSFGSAGLTEREVFARVNRGDLGEPVRVRAVGIGVTPEEIAVDEGFDQRELLATPAFFRAHPEADAGYFGIAVRLRHGDTDLAEFKRAVQRLPHEGAVEFQTMTATRAKVERAVQPSVGALSLFAVVIAVTSALVMGQAIARQSYLDSIDHPVLRAIGLGRSQLIGSSVLKATVVAAGAAVVAVVVAVALSPLSPIGVARTAEPDPGVAVDVEVLLLGAAAVVLAVLVLSVASAWWYTRARDGARDSSEHLSRVAAWLRSVGSPVVASTGVRMALEPGRGRTAVPVRTTVLGTALAIASVFAATTFAASLDHLVSTPRLYGWSWDASINTGETDAQDGASLVHHVSEQLRASQLVDGWSTSVISRVDIDGVTATALGVHHEHGQVGPTIVAGRTPRSDREIALGAKTLDRVGVGIGDTVRVTPDAGGAPVRLRVVGRVVLPGLGTYPGSDKTALGEGALLTRASLRRLGPDFGSGPFLVRLRSGASPAQLRDAVVPADRGADITVSGVERPSDIVNYERVRSTPLLLAGVLALLAMATVAHALGTVVRRRRRDLALLKTLGFTRRQVSGSVAWQATTFGVTALLVGIPVGIVVGRWAWITLADDLGTVAQPIVPLLALLLGVPLVLLLANAVAFVPGRIAAGLRPATVLRSE